ncbi:hypothetical protein K437DRAFT_214889, partial [Tilletiaria anomala UBC 951]
VMASRTAVPALVAGMLATGICNSIFNKYQDMQCVAHCDDPDPQRRTDFTQPVWQTLQMFLGESICLLPVGARLLWEYRKKQGQYSAVALQDPEPDADQGNVELQEHEAVGLAAQPKEMQGRAILLFFTPALCDIIGTSLMNVGLLFTPVSIYQMTRGALVLWVGVFSVIFLRRHLFLFQWVCLAMVMLGVSIVGLSGTLISSSTSDAPSRPDDDLPPATQAILGVLLILFAQIFTATQFVLEEKIMSKYTVEPLLAVGYEGIFGFSTTLVGMIFLHYFIGKTPDGKGGPFDLHAGWSQIISVPAILYSSVAIALSIAFFNFFGLSVTRTVSATARSTIDTCRTLGIWIVSLLVGWEVLLPLTGSLQCLGFIFLVTGTMVFNGVVRPPRFLRP